MTAPRSTRYIRLWHGIGPELGFVLATLPIVVASFAVLLTGIASGIGLVIVWLGIPILALTLRVGRGFASLEMGRLEAAGRPPIARPDWHARPIGRGMMGRLLVVITDGRYWLQLLHGVVVNFVLGIATWSIVIVWLSIALGGPTYGIWGQWTQLDIPYSTGILAGIMAGILAIVALPIVVHAMVLLHYLTARTMLSERQFARLRPIESSLVEARKGGKPHPTS